MIVLLALALAAPDRVAWSEPLGSGLGDLARSEDGSWLATVDAAGVVWLVDTGSWSTVAVSAACAGAEGVGAVPGDGAASFAVGCADGTVDRLDVDDAGAVTISSAAWTAGDGPVHRLATDGTGLYAVVEGSAGWEVAGLDLETGSAGSAFPVALLYEAVNDFELAGTSLLVVHGGDDLSRLATSGGAAVPAAKAQVGRDFVDAWPYSTVEVWLADAANGDALRLSMLDNSFNLYALDLAPGLSALALDEEDGWFAAGGAGGVWLYALVGGAPTGEPDEVALDAAPVEMVEVDGDLLLVDEDGAVVLVTDRPWVEAQVDPPSGTPSTAFSLELVSDRDGAWEVRAGGSVAGDGDLLASGDAVADVPVTVEVDASGFAEGRNRLWVFVDDGARIGHDAVDVEIDTPPDAPDLAADALAPGDGHLTLTFDALDATDVTTYVVYLSDQPFTAEAYPTGGPAWTGDAAVDVPRTLSGVTPGEPVVVELAPLENGTPYYVAVRAWDDGGLEGPMSDILSATPVASFSASELAGDPGGYCAAAPGAGLWLGLVGLAAAALRRAPRALALAAALGAPVAAAAEAREDRPRFHVNLRGGPAWLADEHIQEVFGESAPFFRGEYGLTTRLLELGVGLGYLRKKGYLVDASGEETDEWDKLTLVPGTADLTLRLDVFPEQILVPFARVGADYWLWWERWYVYEGSTADDRRRGGKPGWHWAAGGLLLLDPLDPKAASRMKAVSGIEDTFVMVEYRETTMPEGAKVLELSDREVTFGLKFDF